MTSEIQQNRYDQLVRRVGGIIGPGSKVSEVITELFPVIDVERVPGELLLLAGMRLAHGGGTTTSAAGEVQSWQVFNPIGSGHLIVVTKAVLSAQSTDNFNLDITTTQFASNPGTETFRDSRLGTQDPIGVIGEDSAVGATSPNFVVRVLGNTPYTWEDPNGIAVLFPGSGLNIGNATVQNIIVNAGFFWRERPFEQSEVI